MRSLTIINCTHTVKQVTSVQQCVTAIEQWMATSRLRLNMDKTELIWTGTKHNLSKIPGSGRALTLGAAHVAQSDDVRVLGVQLSSDLSLDKHVNVVSANASFNYDNYAAFDVLWMTTLSLHSFMRSSRAEWIIAAVS